MARPGAVGLVVLVVVLVVVAGVGAGPTASARTASAVPSWSRLETGVGAVQGVRCDGRPARQLGLDRPNGTAFLIGRRVMMTAAHVVKGWLSTTQACSLRVRIGRTWYSASRPVYWADRRSREYPRADIATFSLGRRAQGHVFDFATKTPDLRSRVWTAGFPWGEPLEISSGVLVRRVVSRGTPLIVVEQDGIDGSHSGGPIVNARGDVIGVVSRAVPSRPLDPNAIPSFGGVDIPKWWAGRVVEDLCRLYPGKGVPGCSRVRSKRTKDAVPITK